MDEQPLFPSTVPARDLLPDLYGRDGHTAPVVVFSAQDTPEVAARMLAVLTKSRASIGGLVATLRKLVGNRPTLVPGAAPIDAPAKKEEFA